MVFQHTQLLCVETTDINTVILACLELKIPANPAFVTKSIKF
jgi:hypothetical protein